MTHKKYGNKKLAEAIRAARGERSLREYAADTGVNYMTIYKLEKGETSPGPKTLKKLTTGNAKPRNNITYDTVMIAAGYQNDKGSEEFFDARKSNILAYSIMMSRTMGDFKNSEGNMHRHYVLGLLSVTIKQNKNLDVANINYPIHESETKSIDMVVQLNNNAINEWWIDYRHTIAYYHKYLQEFAFSILGKLAMQKPNKARKISLVLDDKKVYQYFKDLANIISFKGDLSVIFIDANDGEIVEEAYISHYDDSPEREFFII